ncbi:MAG: hypothetical protein H3C26_04465 [Rhodocyclaceae bacterium]|nr:hypothetical protein [Rhodocyclaceae bacterium]
MQLPNCTSASIDIRKLHDYALDPNHPEGRHKARVFLSALGLGASDSEWLAAAILGNICAAEAVEFGHTAWGTIYKADIQIWRGNRCAKLRTGWLCRGDTTKLTTCFIVGERDETA